MDVVGPVDADYGRDVVLVVAERRFVDRPADPGTQRQRLVAVPDAAQTESEGRRRRAVRQVGLARVADRGIERRALADRHRATQVHVVTGRVALLVRGVDLVGVDALVEAGRNEDVDAVEDLVTQRQGLDVLGAVSAGRRQADRRDRAVVVVPVLNRRALQLVEEAVELLVEAEFHRHRIDDGRRLRESHVRGAERLRGAPDAGQPGQVEVLKDLELAVDDGAVILEVLRRGCRVETEARAGEEVQFVSGPFRPQGHRRAPQRDERPGGLRRRGEHVGVVAGIYVEHRVERKRAEAHAQFVRFADGTARRRRIRHRWQVDLRRFLLLLDRLAVRRRRIDLRPGRRRDAAQQHPADGREPREFGTAKANRHGIG